MYLEPNPKRRYSLLPVIPDDLDDNALLELAKQYQAQGAYKKSEKTYRFLINKHPDVAELWMNLGSVLRQQKAYLKSKKALEKALDLSPSHPGAFFNLANTLRDLGQPVRAQEHYRRCIEHAPDFVDAYLNSSSLYSEQGEHETAIELLTTAIEAGLNHPALWNNRGNIYKQNGLLEAAKTDLVRAVKCEPGASTFRRNLASVFYALGRSDDALSEINQALEYASMDAEAYCLRAFIQLSVGNFQAGWQDYEWRWKSREHTPPRPYPYPIWDGSDLAGKSLLVWGEQGVGDEIMFASILPNLLRNKTSIALECEPRLVDLFKRSFPELEVLPSQLPPHKRALDKTWDLQIPIGGLAKIYRDHISDFEDPAPYLRACPVKRQLIRERYQNLTSGGPIIGVAWKSGARHTGQARSLELEDLLPVFKTDGAVFINLQYGDVDSEVKSLAERHGVEIHIDTAIDQMEDLDGFASQVAALDRVITVANTTAHFAGALGVPADVLIPDVADWRWMNEGAESHWYQSIKLHRLKAVKDPNRYVESIAQILNVNI